MRIARTRPSALADWDSFAYNLQRTGYNPLETVVSPSNVGSLQKLWSLNVGAEPMREPVLASKVTISGQSENVLYVGSNDGATLDALNAQTGTTIWQQSIPSLSYKCDGVGSSLQWSNGATPAIDRKTGRIYVADGLGRIHAFALATGHAVTGWPISVAKSDGGHDLIHAGLTFNPANGMLYVEMSSPCDWTPWRGRIIAVDTAMHKVARTFYVVTRSGGAPGGGGGIWAGGGASIDPGTNDVLISTGNADASVGLPQNYQYAESIVDLSSDLSTVVASNYPANIPHIEGMTDFDFGSTPVVFTPPGCPEMTAILNKSGMFELYDVSTIAEGPVQYAQMSISTDAGDFQEEVVYDPVTNYLYVGLPATFSIYKPGLGAFAIQSNCTINPTPVWNAEFGPDGATTPKSVPRSAVTIANGVAYVSNSTGDTEFAFDAQSGAQLWSTPLTGHGKPGTIVANGVVYVMDVSGNLTAWAPPSESSVPILPQLVQP